MINKITKESKETLIDEKLKDDLTKVGKDVGCSPELTEKLIEFILRG
jgi:hypothetical protein